MGIDHTSRAVADKDSDRDCMRTLLCLIASGIAAAQTPAGEKALFEDLPVVEAAALHAQTLEEAPANVTIITAAEIRKYGYRTLGEALASVRGFDITYDHIYHYVGVHGFSLPGDYNTRFLVMINGHPMTENVFGSNNFFGQDFGLDMDLIQRIEVVRGPSSALYGSNGMFATINVVTKSPVDQPRVRMTAEYGSFGEKKASVSGSPYLGHGANLLIQASVFNTAGGEVYVPEFNTSANNAGLAEGTDGERGYHTFAHLVWRNWTVSAYFNSREKQSPLSWDPTALFDVRGPYVRDGRSFVNIERTDSAGSGQIHTEISYDRYRFLDRFYYPLDSGTQDERNAAWGDWLTARVTYSVPLKGIGGFTAGAEGIYELRNLQENYTASPAFEPQMYVTARDRGIALFAQQEWNIARRWTATAGLRFDDTRNFGHFLSPRAAVVYQWSGETVYKFVYGHPFRNPTAYEQFYSDGVGYIANLGLRPETAHTFELSGEHKFGKNITAIANVYHYQISNIIQVVSLPSGMAQYQNTSWAKSDGAELELNEKFRLWEGGGSVSLQNTDGPGGRLPNSAHVLAKGRAALPLFRNRILVSTELKYMSARLTWENAAMRPVVLNDLTVTWDEKRFPWRLQFGVRNLFNYVYDDPIALAVDEIRSLGRTAFLKLSWQFGG